MDPKKLLPLALVLAVLAGVAVWTQTQDRQRQATMQLERQPSVSLGIEADALAVSGIEINRPEKSEKISLAKKPSGEWALESHFGTRARKATVENFLKELGSVSGEVRAEDPAVLGDFRLSDEQAIHIRLTGPEGRETAHALLSPLRPRGTQNFIRRAGSHQVLLTTTDLLGTLGLYSDDDKLSYRLFADLRLVDAEPAKIAALELSQPGSGTLRFDRKENDKDKTVTWALQQDAQAEVETAKVDEFISSLRNLHGRESVDPAAHLQDFAGAPWIKIHLQAGEMPETVEVFAGPADKDRKIRRVRIAPDNLVYELSDTALDALLKRDKSSFLKTKAA